MRCTLDKLRTIAMPATYFFVGRVLRAASRGGCDNLFYAVTNVDRIGVEDGFHLDYS